jgi:hypothetical protein
VLRTASLSDELNFAAEAAREEQTQGYGSDPWRVLVLDDDPDVFRVSELSLMRLWFHDRAVQLLTACSGGAARLPSPGARHRGRVDRRGDGNGAAGLDLIRTIRNEFGLSDTRIILRTGQPGRAPERDVILNYEIDGYADKAELTAMKLFTNVVAALRAYETMSNLSRLTAELEKRMATRTAELWTSCPVILLPLLRRQLHPFQSGVADVSIVELESEGRIDLTFHGLRHITRKLIIRARRVFSPHRPREILSYRSRAIGPLYTPACAHLRRTDRPGHVRGFQA